ncbi:unnamed protein product [Arctia plantaginis]|uniref:Uncharacterized protein n=1 Tax=Arctia plantaginis TaxID=874455 RepID=A0A8S1B4E0_ARCPL|nr:unnamed protein product [Arctia plantaginis]
MSPLSSNSSSVMSPPPISRSQVSETDSSRITKKKKTDRISQSSPPTQTLFQSYLEKKYQSLNQGYDTMVDFFTNLGKTVTTFPKDVQIRVKGAVFKIVNDAETDLFCRQVDTNNMSHASRESQNMQTINQQPFAAVILSQNNQFSSIQPLRTSGQASFQASPTTASMLSNSSQQVYEGQVYEVQEHDVQDSEIMEQFLHFPKNK